MIDFEAIEFFFAKESRHQVNFPLTEKNMHKENKATSVNKKTISMEKKQAITPACPIKKIRERKPILKVNAPIKEKKDSKDHFYSEWEKKYKSLRAENLLAKQPFKKLALFIIDEKTNKDFAEKIYSAINTRLMKSTFIVSDKPIQEHIEEYNPTHVITTKSVSCHLPLPGVLIDNLKDIEKCPKEKKKLWQELKQALKG